MVCPGDYENELSIERDGEEDSVTLQVGMMARDGIILAGDVWTYTNVRTIEVGKPQVWAGGPVSKMTITKSGSIAISWAQDIRQAKLVADAIATGLTSEYWGSPEQRIEEIVEAALSSEKLQRGVECLIALNSPTFSLFKAVWATDQATQKNVCDCTRAPGPQVFIGDCHNPATFWATRYLLVNPERDPTLDELLPLAVQIVVDAWEISRGNIRGLEIIRCDREGFHRLPVEQCKVWAAEAVRRSRTIEKMVMAPLPLSEHGPLAGVGESSTEAKQSPLPLQE